MFALSIGALLILSKYALFPSLTEAKSIYLRDLVRMVPNSSVFIIVLNVHCDMRIILLPTSMDVFIYCIESNC